MKSAVPVISTAVIASFWECPLGSDTGEMPASLLLVEDDEQRVYVFSPTRRLIATLPVSTGLDDSTPTGSFRVFSKSEQAFYAPNPGERMKWMVRFTRGRQGDNIGFHGIPYRVTSAGNIPIPTPVGIKPVSHGCIRTRDIEAQWLFENMPIGTPVRVVQSRQG